MSTEEYNYAVFKSEAGKFEEFAALSPKATMRAPSFPLEDLNTGETVEMKALWKTGVTVIEFGSFT